MQLSPKLRDAGVREVIHLDTEFIAQQNEHVIPVCLCAHALVSEQEWRVWLYDNPRQSCPLPDGPDVLFVAYSAPAEWSTYLSCGWELPGNVIDLHAIHKMLLNGSTDRKGSKKQANLLSAAEMFGIDAMLAIEKDDMRNLVLRGGPYTGQEQAAILDYCRRDVALDEQIFSKMLPYLHVGNDCTRGDYTRVLATIDWNGIPVDVDLISRFKAHWKNIRYGIARDLEESEGYGIYDLSKGVPRFSHAAFGEVINRRGLADKWPRTKDGKYSTADPKHGPAKHKVMKRMADMDPYFKPLRETMRLLSDFKTFDLPVGGDGRCRARSVPWHQATGRTSPLKGSIFALPAWARFLIKPAVGRAVAYVDLVSAEYGIGAALSGDEVMLDAYTRVKNGTLDDIYLDLARRMSRAPKDATKASHKDIRKTFKIAALAMQYGQEPEGCAASTGMSVAEAQAFHAAHRRIHHRYWDYVERQVVEAEASGSIETRYGWRLTVYPWTKRGTLLDFQMQATCADIMRRATVLMLDEGLMLCATAHDAVLLESSVGDIEAHTETAKNCWRQASQEILDYELDADAKIIKYPDRYDTSDGEEAWFRLLRLLEKSESDAAEQNVLFQMEDNAHDACTI